MPSRLSAIALLGLLIWCILPLPSQTVAEGGVSSPLIIPSSYFGLTVLNFKSVRPQPPFGTARSWDEYSSPDWAKINPLPGFYNFSSIDAFIAINQNHRAIVGPRWLDSYLQAGGGSTPTS